MTDEVSIEEFLATAAPRTEKVRVCARNDLVELHLQAVQALDEVRRRDAPNALATDEDISDELTQLAAKVVDVEAEMERFTLEVELRGIGAQAWADLLRVHPPMKEHRGYAHNPETFPPAAVSACAVNPVVTEDQATRMFAKLASAEWTKLWIAAVGLNELETPRPKLLAAADLVRTKRPSAGSSDSGGSLAEPSSDGSGEQ